MKYLIVYLHLALFLVSNGIGIADNQKEIEATQQWLKSLGIASGLTLDQLKKLEKLSLSNRQIYHKVTDASLVH